jgi:hypothetical protein
MKYKIEKLDGSQVDPEACYFVLRLDTDPAARKAAMEYARTCDDRELAHKLTEAVTEIEAPCTCRGVDGYCRKHGTFSAVWRHGEQDEAAKPVVLDRRFPMMSTPNNVDRRADVCIEAEKRLADLNGWTGIVRAGNTLLGTPPGGSPHSRGQAIVPAWARMWIACGPLIAEHDLNVVQSEMTVEVQDIDGIYMAHEVWGRHPSKESAIMYTIVQAVIAKLEANNV